MKKHKTVALTNGVTGKDGALLSKFLLDKNYIVHGINRRSSTFNTERIDDLINRDFDQDVPLVMLIKQRKNWVGSVTSISVNWFLK